MNRPSEGNSGAISGKLASITFILVTLIYGLLVVIADQYVDVDVTLGLSVELGAFLFVTIFASWFLRYLRWNYLLCRLDNSPAFLRGFVIYLSGFAFTATPGKAGELVRAKYLSKSGVTKTQVVAAFLFERSLDLTVLLIIASFAFLTHDLFYLSAVFIGMVLSSLVLFVFITCRLERNGGNTKSRVVWLLARVRCELAACSKQLKNFVTLYSLLVSFSLGLFSWSLIAVSFVLLLHSMNIGIPLNVGFSAYPLSMLAGAASMLPGGIGATETSLTLILTQHGVEVVQAISAAIAIRLLTLWSAMLVGALCVSYLELEFTKYNIFKPTKQIKEII